MVKVTIDMYGNMIETKAVCASPSNLTDMLALVRGCTILILKVRGQRSRIQMTCIEIIL